MGVQARESLTIFGVLSRLDDKEFLSKSIFLLNAGERDKEFLIELMVLFR